MRSLSRFRSSKQVLASHISNPSSWPVSCSILLVLETPCSWRDWSASGRRRRPRCARRRRWSSGSAPNYRKRARTSQSSSRRATSLGPNSTPGAMRCALSTVTLLIETLLYWNWQLNCARTRFCKSGRAYRTVRYGLITYEYVGTVLYDVYSIRYPPTVICCLWMLQRVYSLQSTLSLCII